MSDDSKITTVLEVDDPIEIDSDFLFDDHDRRFIDQQIRGLSQHLVDSLIRGRHATWVDLAQASGAVAIGDTVCSASDIAFSLPTVTKSNATSLSNAVAVFGIVLRAANPGSKVLVATSGLLSPVLTGLARSAKGQVRVNTTTSRCERVGSLGGGDYGIGTVDDAGWLTFPPPTANITVAGTALPAFTGALKELRTNATNDGAEWFTPSGIVGIATVANLAALTALATTTLTDGALAYVQTLRAYFTLDKTNNPTADGITVVNGASSTKWYRIDTPHPSWAIQDTWYVNAGSGNDENVGDAGHPIKTLGELARRWRRQVVKPISTVTTVHVVGNIGSADPFSARDFIVGSDCSIIFVGDTVTSVRTGSFTALTAINRGTNVALSATDGAMGGTWTTDLGRRVRITAGPNIGQKAWVAQDLGSKTAKFSTPHIVPVVASLAPFLGVPLTTMGVFSNGDAYAVETLSTIYIDDLDVRSEGLLDLSSGAWEQIVFVDFDVRSIAGTNIDASPVVHFYGCSFTATQLTVTSGALSGSPIFNNCGVSGSGLSLTSGYSLFWGGLIRGGGITGQAGGAISFDGDVMCEGAILDVAYLSTFVFVLCAMFNSPGAGCQIFPGSVAALDAAAGVFSLAALWGSGNTDVGIDVLSDAALTWDGTTVPTVTGAAGNLRLAGRTTARAFNEAAGDYMRPLACTWANLSTSIASGGFGGSAHSIDGSARVVSAVRDAGVAPYVVTAVNHTWAVGEKIVEFSAYAKTHTLPDPGLYVGQEITTIAKVEAGTGAPTPGNEFVINSGTKTIDGATNYTQQVKNETATVKWNGTQWRLV